MNNSSNTEAAPSSADGNAPQLAEDLPMLPLYAGAIVKFTPASLATAEPKPLFHLKVPSISDRAGFERDLVTRCGVMPDQAFMVAALRRGIRTAYSGADLDEALAAIAELEPIVRGKAPDEGTIDAFLRWREIERDVMRSHFPFAALVADRNYFNQLYPLVTLQHFLVGWDNFAGTFERKSGLTTERTITQLDRLRYLEVSTKAMTLLGAGQGLAKN